MPTQQTKQKASPRATRAGVSGEPIQIIHGGRPNIVGYPEGATRSWPGMPTAGETNLPQAFHAPIQTFGTTASPPMPSPPMPTQPLEHALNATSPWQIAFLAAQNNAANAAQSAVQSAALATALQAQNGHAAGTFATIAALQSAQAQAALAPVLTAALSTPGAQTYAPSPTPYGIQGSPWAPRHAGAAPMNANPLNNNVFAGQEAYAPGREAHESSLTAPAANIQDEGSAYLCTFDIPGVTAADVSLTYANGILFVQAVRSIESDVASILQAEHSPSQVYRRALPLPGEVTGSDADASLKGGVLTVRLPKAQPTQPPSMITVKE